MQNKPMFSSTDYEFALLLDSPDDARKDLSTVLGQRRKLVERLMEIVDPANSDEYGEEQRKAAAVLLGEFRAHQAVPVLIIMLREDVKLMETWFNGIDPLDHPASNALAKIGREALPALVDVVKETDDPGLREKAVALILHCVGTKRFLLDVLRRLAEKEENGETRDRLVAAHNWAEATLTETEEPIY